MHYDAFYRIADPRIILPPPKEPAVSGGPEAGPEVRSPTGYEDLGGRGPR